MIPPIGPGGKPLDVGPCQRSHSTARGGVGRISRCLPSDYTRRRKTHPRGHRAARNRYPASLSGGMITFRPFQQLAGASHQCPGHGSPRFPTLPCMYQQNEHAAHHGMVSRLWVPNSMGAFGTLWRRFATFCFSARARPADGWLLAGITRAPLASRSRHRASQADHLAAGRRSACPYRWSPVGRASFL
jgi:hypothetical protein